LTRIKAGQRTSGYIGATPGMNHLPIVPTTRVGDIVAAHPLLATMFERVGIDYCCGGKKTLADSCAAKGLDAATLAAALDAAVQLATTSVPAIDVAGLSLTALADHIERTHHAYLKEELPQLVEKAVTVAHKHGWRDPRLPAVAETTRALADEMFHHMAKEERILFPIIRSLEGEKSNAAADQCGSITNPIRQMEAEHDSAGGAVARLRELTNGFAPDADACNTHRALLAGLARLESDLHQHVHTENNILFPRAIAFEEQVSGTA
jgi:regulator of cell morphogenesis and NO signaling